MYYWLSSAPSGMPSPSASGSSGRPATLVSRDSTPASTAALPTMTQLTSPSTPVPDTRYYEATYNGDKEDVYLDAYVKEQNSIYFCQSIDFSQPHIFKRNFLCDFSVLNY